MSLARVIGLFLVILGLVVLVIGFQHTESVTGELKKLFTGDFRDGASWVILSATVACILGVVAMTRPARRFVGVE